MLNCRAILIISASLQGIGYNQTFRYFRLYPNDPGYLKIWVSMISITLSYFIDYSQVIILQCVRPSMMLSWLNRYQHASSRVMETLNTVLCMHVWCVINIHNSM